MTQNGSTLGALMGDRDNNYNLMRCLAAGAVLVAHSYALVTGDPRTEPFREQWGKSVGTMAVDMFFLISGLLITASLIRRPDVYAFAAARIVRIFPALIVANVLTVFVLGPWLTYLSPSEYFSDLDTYSYFVRNNLLLFKIQYDLPGLFHEVPYAVIVNGSLWTLPHELRLYGAIALTYYACGVFAHRRQAAVYWLVPAIAMLAAAAWWFAPYVTGVSKPPSWLRLAFLFYLGASCYLWRDHIKLHHWGILPATVAVTAGLWLGHHGGILYCLGLAYWVFYLAYIPTGVVRGYNRLGDYSYGLYIFAFPVQQTMMLLFPAISLPEMIAASGVVTLALAVASWNLVESPCLNHKKAVASWLRSPTEWRRSLTAPGTSTGG